MRYESIEKALFVNNRRILIDQLKPESLVILHSADPQRLSGDGVLPFRQDSNFFYLTGIDQEDSILILAPDLPDKKLREVLLIKETNDKIRVWEGEKLSQEQASNISGIRNVVWNKRYDDILEEILPHIRQVYLDLSEEKNLERFPVSKNARLGEAFAATHPDYPLENLLPKLTHQRMIKSQAECSLIQKAGEITKMGYERVLGFIRPGIWEYEIEAEFIAEFVRNRSRGFAYNPIIASGSNACVLHYEQNNQRCTNGQLVLLDVAAEYAHYNSDVTRTIPVNGRFTARQKEIYRSVFNAKKFASDLLRPGITFKEYNSQIGKFMEDELVRLGLLDKTDIKSQDPANPLYKKYYMHSTSHHLGLDVHDVAERDRPLEVGMVLTVEPGLYIPKEGIGIRLEDDILIGEGENINLTPDIPIEIDEIEELMNRK